MTGRVTQDDGQTWLRIDVLGRPNGRSGWVPDDALGPLHKIDETLVINRSALRANLYRGKRKLFSAPIGIGRGKWPTPPGDFYIREAIRIKRGGGVYGSFAFGTSAYSPSLSDWPGGGVIGIHGTNEPNLIPGRISHGCIRMRNPQINRLRRLAGVGTAVEIRLAAVRERLQLAGGLRAGVHAGGAPAAALRHGGEHEDAVASVGQRRRLTCQESARDRREPAAARPRVGGLGGQVPGQRDGAGLGSRPAPGRSRRRR